MIVGRARTFHKKFKFLVFIDGYGDNNTNEYAAAFQKCSELSVELAEVAYHEGGALLPMKEPGKATIADITLERAACYDVDTYNWLTTVIDVVNQKGAAAPKYKRDLTIVQYDRDDRVLRKWEVKGAWLKKFVAGDWDNEADDNVIEQATLCIDYFRLVENNA